MASRIAHLTAPLAKVEDRLDATLARARAAWHYRIDGGHVRFDPDVQRLHRLTRRSLARFIVESTVASLVTAPLIYSVIVPVVVLDVWMSVYQAICFRAYDIPRVPRSAYIVMDRHHLGYLNAIEKLNCAYCGYVNGVFAYVREIASRTEEYWCPIRNAGPVLAPHSRYHRFLDYGDANGYRRRLARWRGAQVQQRARRR